MSPPPRIFVAIDLSAPARHAVDRACLLAAHAKGELHIVHALELDVPGLLWRAGVEQQAITQYVKADLNQHRTRLHDVAAEAGLMPAHYSVRVLHGDPSQQIIAMEQEYDADLNARQIQGRLFAGGLVTELPRRIKLHEPKMLGTPTPCLTCLMRLNFLSAGKALLPR
jgi:hypothetical protein